MRTHLNPVIALMIMLILSSCTDPVGTVTYETADLPNGTRSLVIKATDSKDAPISGFNLQITGPTTATATVSGSEYEFTNIQSGLYSLTITKEGYIGVSYQLPVTLPSNPKANFKATATVKITQLASAVSVESAGRTIQVPGPAASGPRSQPSLVTIPSGALPATGTTQVTITHIAPKPILLTAQSQKAAPSISVENTLDRIPLDTFIFTFTRDGVPVAQFLQPVSVSVPMSVPSSIRGEAFSFVLMSGSGPDATPTNEFRPITIDANGNASMSVLKPGTYKVYVTLGLTTALTHSASIRIGTTSCGLGGSFSFSSPSSTALGSVMIFLGIVPSALTLTTTEVLEPTPGSLTALNGIYNFIDYTVFQPGGAQIEKYRYPLPQVSTSISTHNCHNSGGN